MLALTDNMDKILTLCDEVVPGHTQEFFFDRNHEDNLSLRNTVDAILKRDQKVHIILGCIYN